MDRQSTIAKWALQLGFQILFYAIIVASLPVSESQNTTIVVPASVTNHGSPNLLCKPTSWSDVALFYLGNYAAHAVTVRASPGEPLLDKIVNTIFVLLFPQAGVIKGLNAIFRCAVLEKSPLQRAARSGALGMVARTSEWRPQENDTIRGIAYLGPQKIEEAKKKVISIKFNNKPEEELKELRGLNEPVTAGVWAPPWLRQTSRLMWPYTDTLSFYVPWGRDIHGVCKLPSGYTLAFVPRHAEVRNIPAAKPKSGNTNNELEDSFDSTISASFSVTKAAIAILQTLYASFTLYRTRGDQLTQFGYAAFGLTVTPFLVMSIINLIGNMVTPEYTAIYMVRSDIMEEAIRRGAVIDGAVGEIVPAESSAWMTGNPNDLSGAIVSIDQDDMKMRDITYSTRDTATLQQRDPELTSKLKEDDDITKLTSPAPLQDDGDAKEGICEIDAEKPATGTNAPIKLKWVDLTLNKTPESIPTLLFPACNNFATTAPQIGNFSLDITDVGQLPCLQRFFVKHTVIISFIVIVAVNLAISSISIAIIGGISKFDKGHSTAAQRVWTMTWLSLGFYIGMNIPFHRSPTSLIKIFKDPRRETRDADDQRFSNLMMYISSFLYGVPAIGGYVVVGKMLYDYGNCIDIS